MKETNSCCLRIAINHTSIHSNFIFSSEEFIFSQSCEKMKIKIEHRRYDKFNYVPPKKYTNTVFTSTLGLEIEKFSLGR